MSDQSHGGKTPWYKDSKAIALGIFWIGLSVVIIAILLPEVGKGFALFLGAIIGSLSNSLLQLNGAVKKSGDLFLFITLGAIGFLIWKNWNAEEKEQDANHSQGGAHPPADHH